MLRQLASGIDASAGSASVNVKAWKQNLGPLFSQWENVSRSQLSKLKSIEIRPVSPDDHPIVAFVLMDAHEASKLGDMVTNSLNTLQKVISGSVLSTPDIQAEASYLLRSEVPGQKLAHQNSQTFNVIGTYH